MKKINFIKSIAILLTLIFCVVEVGYAKSFVTLRENLSALIEDESDQLAKIIRFYDKRKTLMTTEQLLSHAIESLLSSSILVISGTAIRVQSLKRRLNFGNIGQPVTYFSNYQDGVAAINDHTQSIILDLAHVTDPSLVESFINTIQAINPDVHIYVITRIESLASKVETNEMTHAVPDNDFELSMLSLNVGLTGLADTLISVSETTGAHAAQKAIKETNSDVLVLLKERTERLKQRLRETEGIEHYLPNHSLAFFERAIDTQFDLGLWTQSELLENAISMDFVKFLERIENEREISALIEEYLLSITSQRFSMSRDDQITLRNNIVFKREPHYDTRFRTKTLLDELMDEFEPTRQSAAEDSLFGATSWTATAKREKTIFIRENVGIGSNHGEIEFGEENLGRLFEVRTAHYEGKLYYAKMVNREDTSEGEARDMEKRFLLPQVEYLTILSQNKVKGIPNLKGMIQLKDGRRVLLFEDIEKFSKGETLMEKIKSKPDMSVEEVVPIILEVSKIVQVLAKYGMTHNDIKPSNIWIADDGTVVLTDFDMVFKGGNDFRERNLFGLGTHFYMSLRRADDQIPTISDEIYSLAMSLAIVMIMSHRKEQIQQPIYYSRTFTIGMYNYFSLSEIEPQNTKLHNLLSKALSPKSSERYVDINHFVADLKSIDNETIEREIASKTLIYQSA